MPADAMEQWLRSGRPAQIDGVSYRPVEQGQISAAFAADVNAARLIRLSEWRTPAGTIRLGIPRRLDRRVRIEVQLAPSFPSSRETLWSIEAVK